MINLPVELKRYAAQQLKMCHLCGLKGCSGFDLGPKRRSGCKPQWLSDPAGGSDPWTKKKKKEGKG